MTLEPRDLEDGNCNDCDFWRSRISRKKGVLIPGGYGKCTRPEGHCVPHTARGGIGHVDPARQVKEIIQQQVQENQQMAKRDNALFKRTAIEPEVVDEAPASLENENDGYVPVVYDGFDDSPPDFVKPLSATETKRRQELEGIITRNFKAFYDVGCALREIQQKRLYRSTHKAFADYCKDLWEMGRQYAYRLIDASQIVDEIKMIFQKLSPIGDNSAWVPQNESQARALIKLKDDPEAIKTIIEEAVRTAPAGKVTASHIKKTAKKLHLLNVGKTVHKARTESDRMPKIDEDFRKAFNIFLDAINIERANEFKNTDRNEVIRHVRVILDALEAEL